jgi:hypothetical protein
MVLAISRRHRPFTDDVFLYLYCQIAVSAAELVNNIATNTCFVDDGSWTTATCALLRCLWDVRGPEEAGGR